MRKFTHQNCFGYTSKQLTELNRRLLIAIETLEPETDEELNLLEDKILDAFDVERKVKESNEQRQ